MVRVGVSGAAGRMGGLTAATVAAAPDLELAGCYGGPRHAGELVAGMEISSDPGTLDGCDVVVEFTRPDVAMDNLERWRALGSHAVVGTSGFDAARFDRVRKVWGDGPPNCLIVPNFSLGAAVMMRIAEMAAPWFAAAEIVELHHDRKVDAPSGTAISTAERLAAAMGRQTRAVESSESVASVRGGDVAGVPVHSVRLPGLLAHQEVLLGNPGEVLTIRHDSISLASFEAGILLAIRGVSRCPGVTAGLDGLLDL